MFKFFIFFLPVIRAAAANNEHILRALWGDVKHRKGKIFNAIPSQAFYDLPIRGVKKSQKR